MHGRLRKRGVPMDSTDRKALIRAHFETYRDLAWTENFLPRFERYGVSGTRLETYREAWNRGAEQRDWGRWQEESEKYPNERLQDMLTDYIETLDALGMPRWQIGRRRYGDILNDMARTKSGRSYPSPGKTEGTGNQDTRSDSRLMPGKV
jgi:hypothetical protein